MHTLMLINTPFFRMKGLSSMFTLYPMFVSPTILLNIHYNPSLHVNINPTQITCLLTLFLSPIMYILHFHKPFPFSLEILLFVLPFFLCCNNFPWPTNPHFIQIIFFAIYKISYFQPLYFVTFIVSAVLAFFWFFPTQIKISVILIVSKATIEALNSMN